MTRIEKSVVIVLGVLSLAFLGQIVGSSKSQDAPVVAHAAPAAPVATQAIPAVVRPDPAQADCLRMAEQLRGKVNVIRDKTTRGCRQAWQTSPAIDECQSTHLKLSSELIALIDEAERGGRGDLLQALSQRLAQIEEKLDDKQEQIEDLKRMGAICKEYGDLGLYQRAHQCYRDLRDMRRP